MTVDDAIEKANMLIATGRAVHPAKWVTSIVKETERASLAAFTAWSGG